MTPYPAPFKPDECIGAAHPLSSEIQVLFCASRTYIEHAGVAAVSVLESARSRPVHVHLMSCDADAESVRRLRASVGRYPRSRLSIHTVDPHRVHGAFVDRHLTKEAYLRFLAAEILPLSIRRIIYLDCDLVALDDLGPLFDTDLEGRAVGAVPDVDWRAMEDDGRLARLGLGRRQCYVNSGVLVMDLDRWRRDDLAGQIFAFAREKGALLTYHDQDALNVVLKDDILVLNRRWNMQALVFSRWFKKNMAAEHADLRVARHNPAIIHYTTAAKPWIFRTRTPCRSHYYRFRAKSAWDDGPLAGARHRLAHMASIPVPSGGTNIRSMTGVARRIRDFWRSLISH